MSDAANECIPYYEPGTRVTGHCKAAVTGKRFVKIADDIQSGPGLSDTAEGGNVVVEHAGAKEALVLGVTSHDGAKDEKVTILCGPMVVPVLASAAISAGEQVGVAADGKAVKAAAPSKAEVEEGKITNVPAVGLCLADVAEGKDTMVKLYA